MMIKLAVTFFVLVAAAQCDVTKHAENYAKHSAHKHEPIVPPAGLMQMQGVQGNNHSLILGQRRYGDSLIHTDVAKKTSKWFRIVETDIKFPSNGAKNTKTINYLQVLDRKANGHSGWPYLTQGGIGFKNVSLHFTSERGHGFDFLIYVYGYNG
ncbi:probable salivary secreted peptide [Bemisia tabaci]|uniref:probable salivary secreted peptide n=1 Tax=Bemisia tabaci TaxID=7038 RepID=UPI003B2850CA